MTYPYTKPEVQASLNRLCKLLGKYMPEDAPEDDRQTEAYETKELDDFIEAVFEFNFFELKKDVNTIKKQLYNISVEQGIAIEPELESLPTINVDKDNK